MRKAKSETSVHAMTFQSFQLTTIQRAEVGGGGGGGYKKTCPKIFEKNQRCITSVKH